MDQAYLLEEPRGAGPWRLELWGGRRVTGVQIMVGAVSGHKPS